MRDLIEVSWNDEPVAGTQTGIHYSAANGVSLVEPELAAKTFYDIMCATVDYLTNIDIEGERIPALRKQLDNLLHPNSGIADRIGKPG